MNLQQITSTTGQVASFSQTLSIQPDPLQSFRALTNQGQMALLLESAEIDSKNSLKSLMLIDAALRIECNGLRVQVEALTDNGKTLLPYLASLLQGKAELQLEDRGLTVQFAKADPLLDEESRLLLPNSLTVLRLLQQQLQNNSDEPLAVFLGGVIGYDLVAMVEDLPEVPTAENQCPDYLFYLAETLLVVDHQAGNSRLIGNVFCGAAAQQQYFVIGQRLSELQQLLQQPAQATTAQSVAAAEVKVDISDADFVAQVEALKQNIVAGDVFQVVPSRCFSLPCPDPQAAYAKLKQQNPSPYMFYLQDRDFSLFGASPESALKYEAATAQVEIYPIAGTRRRGFAENGSIDRDLDSRIELELRQDEKEKAEHLMLVDLARNDVARISVPGSRYVKELLKVDRYSYVMHLVSRVVGTLKTELDALHAYQACMNMGTLVGAPKVRAAELIRGVEKKRRGSYGGAVGYLAGNGDFDSCIVIRSAYVQNGMAYIQAGAGVVYDSVAQAEADETRSKAQAVINAIQSAGAFV
ncbi:anthranilate synthase component I, proteobacterial subset [Rheinheimera sp. A13L]|uniref:anthranilate synthase component 1 n=1 Tax=Rheinheimera sp. A13L TaxID=506534 RepID=UPI00021252F0|nr:anthranilate synthase component 1 [Rheinheimera sp. A13L]EGM78094.1 anthranilate synthase component I, proteobacterial subset [Rheinheimera sp. A13L]